MLSQQLSLDPAHLHVKNLLEGLRIPISKELDVVINKHHWRLMWGHHHLCKKKKKRLMLISAPFLQTITGRPSEIFKWSHMGRL